MASRPGPKLPLFDVELKEMENPRNKSHLEVLVLKSPDTINVVAVTGENELVLVEQFRFGIQESLLELPAGLMDGEEDPLSAAKRELYEETGYQSSSWIATGVTYLNPAYVNNKCFHFLAIDARKVSKPDLDESEDISVHLISDFSVKQTIESNLIVDAIGVAALHKASQHL